MKIKYPYTKPQSPTPFNSNSHPSHFCTKLVTKTDLHFQPTLTSCRISNRLHFKSSSFFFSKNSSKLCCNEAHFSKMCPTFKGFLCTSTYTPIHLSSTDHNRGQVSDFFKINAPLWHKTTWSEIRNFDCPWTVVSFLFKHDHFSRVKQD